MVSYNTALNAAVKTGELEGRRVSSSWFCLIIWFWFLVLGFWVTFWVIFVLLHGNGRIPCAGSTLNVEKLGEARRISRPRSKGAKKEGTLSPISLSQTAQR